MIAIALFALLQGVSFEDKRLGTIDDDVNADMVCFSPDGKSVAYRGLKGGRYAVWTNKTKSPDYTMVDNLSFTRDNRTCFRSATGNVWQIVLGGSPSGPAMPIVGAPVLSPDGKKVAFEASRGSSGTQDKTAWHVITGGAKGADYHTALPPSWSGDGSITGYKVRVAKAGTATMAFHTMNAVVVGSTLGPEYEETTNVYFAPKGKRWAYKARTTREWMLVVDGKTEGGNWKTLSDPIWTADGARYLAVGANDMTKGSIIVNGKTEGEHPDLMFPFWAPNGKQYGLAFRSPEGMRVKFGDKVSEPYREVAQPVANPQGDAVAFAASGKKGYRMVYGGKEGREELASIQAPVWSPDGKHVAFRAMWQFKWIVVMDDGVTEKFDQVGEPSWSPDSAKLAHAAQKDGKWYMVVAYRRGEAYDEVLTPPFWSPDGKMVAFGARKGPDLLWRVTTVE